MNGKIFNAIKIMFIHFIGCALCALQAYISMYEYKDSISSACIRCSYNKDILTIIVFFYLFFVFAYFLFFFFTHLLSKAENIKKIYKIIPIMIIYVATCFTVDNIIFTDRVTSWSTFTANEELASVISRSFSQIFVTAFIFYCLISRFLER